jgi:hypothetical protein
MINRPTLMQLLRQERHPLAILALLAVGLRVTVIMVGLALSPEAAGSGLGLICQPSIGEGERAPGSPAHDPAHCICGPSCMHFGQQAVTAPNSSAWPLPDTGTGTRIALRPGTPETDSDWSGATPIRAPPIALT